MTKASAMLITATCLFVGGGIDHALALPIPPSVTPIPADNSVVVINCKQGGKNCTPLSPNHPVKVKPTQGNAGDCIGSTNETCGYTTHAMVHHATVTSHPTTSGKSNK